MTTEREALDAYGKLPLSFVPNARRSGARVRYSAQGAGFAFAFTQRQALLTFSKGKHGHALALRFLGSADAVLAAERKLPGTVNYLVGNNPSAWRTGLPTYGELVYRNLWPGIDMRVRGQAGTLKYEFHLRPGAEVSDIRLAYRGASGLSLGRSGGLLVRTPLGVLTDAAPRSYQVVAGRRAPVASRYVLQGGTSYGFAVARGYDRARPLVIDPGLVYSTFLGGTGVERGDGIAVDQSGNAYVTGVTLSADYPTTAGAFDTTFNGVQDAFVTKLNPSGSALVYSTYLGGSSTDQGLGITVDWSGNAFVTGETFSADYPTTAGALDQSFNGGQDDAFVAKLSPSGSALVYSTFLGGGARDFGFEIAVDGSGNAYATGNTQSGDFPTTAGAFDQTFNGGLFDAFVTKLNPSGSALVYSTFLGGSSRDDGFDIAIDQSRNAYVTGPTASATDFPTTSGAFNTTGNGGGSDAFVTKLNAAGSALSYSTFLGGTLTESGEGIAVDGSGRAYVTGVTTSASDFPTTGGASDTTHNGGDDAFITRLNAAGSALSYSTFLGGTFGDVGRGIAIDGNGRAYVTGETGSADFPTTTGAFDTTHNGGVADAFVTRLNAAGAALSYSTFLGGALHELGHGIAVDGSRRPYVIGITASPDFPTTAGAFDPTFNGSSDAFVTKLDLAAACPDDDEDDDGLTDDRELLFLTLLGNPDSDGDSVKDGNEDSDDDGVDDEDEDDDEDECPNDSDDDGVDDEDEDDD